MFLYLLLLLLQINEYECGMCLELDFKDWEILLSFSDGVPKFNYNVAHGRLKTHHYFTPPTLLLPIIDVLWFITFRVAVWKQTFLSVPFSIYVLLNQTLKFRNLADVVK